MKILKMRNGIALAAVITIMLITSLFIPVMFSMSDTSLAIAVKGTDRERSSYLARTITEMTVAAFKSFDSTDSTLISGEELTQYNKIKQEYDKLLNGEISEINTEEVAMFSTTKEGLIYYKHVLNDGQTFTSQISRKDYEELSILSEQLIEQGKDPKFSLSTETGEVEDVVYANVGSSEYNSYISDAKYLFVGKGKCTITYDDSVNYYKIITASQESQKLTETEYGELKQFISDQLKNGNDVDFSLSVVENRNVTFTSRATVRENTSERSCVLALQTYPSEEEWLVFGVGNGLENTGGNQVFVDPDKATGIVPIDYSQGIGNNYIKQSMLVYSSVGNMLIQPTEFKDADGNPGYNSGAHNSQFVLGVQPGLNTTPNDDPGYKTIDGVNYDNQAEVAQMNNFVAFAATNAIQVDMPVNLLLNPCRANRLGDAPWVENGSLFKIMIFQAPTIQFNGGIDMMMSFYQRGSEEARRMSSVVLATPESTPYSYYNEQRGTTVKAGMVFFQEDSYLWIIPYGEDGSSSSWAGALAETVYERDSDFTKVKIANKGDVYYFNSDIKIDGERVGFSLTGYFLETEYIPNMESYEEGAWWQIWSNTKNAFFQNEMQDRFDENPTYVKDDFKYVGNMEAGDSVSPPPVDDYYTIWTS